MVYVLNNTSGFFYLSESALKNLHLLPPDFPAQTSLVDVVKENYLCTCSRRKSIPAMPNTVLLERWIHDNFKSSTLNTPILTGHYRKAIGHYLCTADVTPPALQTDVCPSLLEEE